MRELVKKNMIMKSIFLIICSLFCAHLAYAESCSTVGATQDKYTASGCSYTTQTRTCCSDKTWSSWDGSCVDCTTVPSSYTHITQNIYRRAITGGYCIYQGSCNTTSGWSFSLQSCSCTDSTYEYDSVSDSCKPKYCYKSMSAPQSYETTCNACWTKAKNMNNAVPKCSSDTQINCYERVNTTVPDGDYTHVSEGCETNTGGSGDAFGGALPILTMRYTKGSGFCIFEGLKYRISC